MNSLQKRAEVIVVGNELLNGTTLDTNSYWLSKRLVRLGAEVTRKMTVSDNLGEISYAFRAAIRRGSSWIFSLGGLGPTYDDMTLKGLARAVRKKIELNRDAVEMIKESRRRRILSGAKIQRRLLPSTLKMAEIPKGSTALFNSAGTAPGVLTPAGSSKVFSLPGVPREMKAIFRGEIEPLLKKELRGFKRRENWIRALGISESRISPHISRLMEKYSPSVYIKSHPLGFRNGFSLLEFQLSVTPSLANEEVDEKSLFEATRDLITISRRLGARVKKIS